MRNLILLMLLVSLSSISCKTTAILYDPVPNEENKWVAKKKMELKGIGKIEADFEKNTLKRDSGLSLKVPDVSLDIDKLGD